MSLLSEFLSYTTCTNNRYRNTQSTPHKSTHLKGIFHLHYVHPSPTVHTGTNERTGHFGRHTATTMPTATTMSTRVASTTTANRASKISRIRGTDRSVAARVARRTATTRCVGHRSLGGRFATWTTTTRRATKPTTTTRARAADGGGGGSNAGDGSSDEEWVERNAGRGGRGRRATEDEASSSASASGAGASAAAEHASEKLTTSDEPSKVKGVSASATGGSEDEDASDGDLDVSELSEKEEKTTTSEGSTGGKDASSKIEARVELDANIDPFASAGELSTGRLRTRLARARDSAAVSAAVSAAAAAGESTSAAAAAAAAALAGGVMDAVKRFDELEIEVSALDALECQLEDAVSSEDYSNAASLKRAIDALKDSDSTGKCCDDFIKAIAEDRFEDAARLRDAGVGLCGWWAGVEDVGDDEMSSIDDSSDDSDDFDNISPEEASSTSSPPKKHPIGVIMRISREHGRLVGSTFSSRDLADIVELNKAYPKGYDYDAGQPVMEIILQEDASQQSGYRRDIVRLNYIPATIPLDASEEEIEDNEDVPAVGFSPSNKSSVIDQLEAAVDEIEDELRGAHREDIESVKDEIKAKLAGMQNDVTSEGVSALEEIGGMLDKFNDLALDDDDDEDDDDEMLYDIKRSPAALNQESLHAFILTSDNEMLPLDEDDEDLIGARPYSHALDKEIEGFLASKWESMVSDSDAPTTNHAFGAGSHSDLVNAVKEAAQEMFASQDEDDYLEDGEDDEDADEVSAEELLALLGQDSILHRPLPNRVRFQRIDPSLASGSRKDLFDGLYIGAFGPHGPEVLRMVRGRWGDEPSEECDAVTAVKLTGDENVPCGAASFRAKVNKANLITEGGSYPDELGVLARYKGEGRVAKPGFTDSHWVEGELLVLNGKGGSLTGGAELGFVWAVPGERRLLILFSSLVLPEVNVAQIAR